MSESVLAGREPTFRAVTEAVVPEADRLDGPAWQEAFGIVELTLADKPAAMKRQFRLFLNVLEYGAIARYGRRLSALPVERAMDWLRSFERSPVPLLRKGFWGVRTLALMGYYARPAGAASVGYRAAREGWTARQVTP